MSQAPHSNAVADAYMRHGLTGYESPEHLRVLADVLRHDPAHDDAKHPGHAPLVADLRQIYAQLHPGVEE